MLHSKAVTQVVVRLKLAQLEAAELQQGNDVSMHALVSPSTFIASGIDLEHEQCVVSVIYVLIVLISFLRRRLKADIGKQGHTTDIQKAAIQQQRNSLQRKIDAWKRIQALYTPAAQLLDSTVDSPSWYTSDMIAPEDTKLWLPSALCGRLMVCDARLLTIEWELRYAQAGDALEEIRQSLRLRGHMYTFKRDWIRGQTANTRAQGALTRVEAKATAAAEKYRAARAALSTLALVLGNIGWDDKYKVLDRTEDIRGMSVPKYGESEGRKKLSWIWLVEGVGDDQDEVVQDSKFDMNHELCEICN